MYNNDDDYKRRSYSRDDYRSENEMDPEAYKAKLRELGGEYLKKQDPKVGQHVKWKKGLRNRSLPDYEQLMIVIEAIPGRRCLGMPGTAYEDNPANIRAGLIDEFGDFVSLWYDPNRLEICE